LARGSVSPCIRKFGESLEREERGERREERKVRRGKRSFQ
jgi:hypothetical protein